MVKKEGKVAEAVPAENEAFERMYVAPNAPTFQTRLTVKRTEADNQVWYEDVNVRFQHSVYKTSDPEVAAAFDAVLAKPGNGLAQHVQVVDVEAAERLAREYRASLGQSAVQGPFTTEHRLKMLKQTIAASDAQMGQATPEDKAAMEQVLGDALVPLENRSPTGEAPPGPVEPSKGGGLNLNLGSGVETTGG